MSALTEHILNRNGCPLHYWLGGEAGRPLVVLTHGATMDHAMFDAQVKALLPDYRVLTWDARGHGLSQPLGAGFTLAGCAEDLLAILDTVGAEEVVLVGQSMGGYIAQHVYRMQPERVSAVVIIGAINIFFPYSRLDVMMLKASMPMLKLWPYSSFVDTVAKSIAVRPEVQDYARRAIRQIPREDFFTIWKDFTLAISEQGIPNHHIQVPLLITYGEYDKTGNGRIRKQGAEWAAYEPDARCVVIPDASHNANQDNPDFFNRLLLDFLREKVMVRG
jgi:pimeloyl-ACP methyl ester carboxylesterase